MKLCCIYIVWDDWDILTHSVRNMRPLVDGIIIVGSHHSNSGELSEIPDVWINPDLYQYEPKIYDLAMANEKAKRNHGLFLAKLQGYTHFIMLDADEFYEPKPFLKEKERFLNENLNGLVCASQVYFKSPQLTIGLDITLVPFIHKITPNLKFEWNKSYPFAWDKEKRIRIDPTRQMNINSGVEWSEIIMHHFSYVRKDLEKKIRNSTARHNLERSTIRQDFLSAKEGYFVNFYGKKLIRASVDFKIPEFVHEDLQPLSADNCNQPSKP